MELLLVGVKLGADETATCTGRGGGMTVATLPDERLRQLPLMRGWTWGKPLGQLGLGGEELELERPR